MLAEIVQFKTAILSLKLVSCTVTLNRNNLRLYSLEQRNLLCLTVGDATSCLEYYVKSLNTIEVTYLKTSRKQIIFHPINYLVCHKFEVDTIVNAFQLSAKICCRCYVIAVEFSALIDRDLPLRKQR